MLMDPRHDRTPSLAGFALFVSEQPRDRAYDWPDCRRCAVGQYLASLGLDVPLSKWSDSDALTIANRLAHGTGDGSFSTHAKHWTFGQLADRILAHQILETVAI